MPRPPAAHLFEDRYLGYREADLAKPYAHHFRPDVLPVPAHAERALLAGRQPGEFAVPRTRIAGALARPGLLKMETGWAFLPDGELYVAVRTPMPGVSAAMIDWWFGWHIKETARYKLWHPDSHRFTAPAEDRDAPGLPDRERYIGNVSYIDEYIGGALHRLAVHFQEPASLGFERRAGAVTIVGRGGSGDLPVLSAWLIHDVRETPQGCEMRSRFYLGDVAVQQGVPPSAAEALHATGVIDAIRADVAAEGPGLLYHCAAEMNHLAAILPALHAEFAQA
jgi:hypothetical protein